VGLARCVTVFPVSVVVRAAVPAAVSAAEGCVRHTTWICLSGRVVLTVPGNPFMYHDRVCFVSVS